MGNEQGEGDGVGAMIGRELRRRSRSVRWYVLLIGYAVALLIATLVAFWVSDAAAALSNSRAGAATFGVVILLALLFVLVALPPVTGSALGRIGDGAASAARRIVAALAVEAVTALVLVVIALPFLVVAAVSGAVPAFAVLVSALVLLAEIWLLAAIGVAFSGLFARRRGGIGMTYLVTAVLAIGSVLVVTVVGSIVQHDIVTLARAESWGTTDSIADCDAAYAEGATDCVEDGDGLLTCSAWEEHPGSRGRFDLVWWMLAPNPFVVVADAASATGGAPDDVLRLIVIGVHEARESGKTEQILDSCTIDGQNRASTIDGVLADTPGTWGWGLLAQAVIAGVLLWGAHARLRRRARNQL